MFADTILKRREKRGIEKGRVEGIDELADALFDAEVINSVSADEVRRIVAKLKRSRNGARQEGSDA